MHSLSVAEFVIDREKTLRASPAVNVQKATLRLRPDHVEAIQVFQANLIRKRLSVFAMLLEIVTLLGEWPVLPLDATAGAVGTKTVREFFCQDHLMYCSGMSRQLTPIVNRECGAEDLLGRASCDTS